MDAAHTDTSGTDTRDADPGNPHGGSEKKTVLGTILGMLNDECEMMNGRTGEMGKEVLGSGLEADKKSGTGESSRFEVRGFWNFEP